MTEQQCNTAVGNASGHQPHPHKSFPVPTHPTSFNPIPTTYRTGCNPILTAVPPPHEIPHVCLDGSVGWDTVRTDRDGLSEKPGFNPRVDR